MLHGKTSSLTLAAVGDVRPQWPEIHAAGNEMSALPLLAADLIIGNLEIVLTEDLPAAAKPVVARAEPATAALLRQLRLNAVSLANNHVFDYGIEGFNNTCAILRDAGIAPFGAGDNAAAAWKPLIVCCNGRRVALLAFAATVPPGSGATADRPGIAGFQVETAYRIDAAILHEQPGTPPYVETWVPEPELARLRATVAEARAAADVVVVSAHWGVAYQDEPAAYQRQLADALADAGADLILGHHPHQLQGVGMAGTTPVVYSLGDFLSHFRRPSTVRFPGLSNLDPAKVRRSLIARATFEGGGGVRLELVPLVLDERGEPRLAEGDDRASLLEWLRRLSAPLGAALRETAEGAVLVRPVDRPAEGLRK